VVTVLVILTLFFALIFAMNMGSCGIVPAFAPAYGSKTMSFKKIILLFAVAVILGAIALGGRVVTTLSKGLMPEEIITLQIALIILLSACIGLLIGNALKVPLPTSGVTVAAIVAVSIFYWCLNLSTFITIILLWLIMPIIAFIFAFLLRKYIYAGIARRLQRRKPYLRIFIIIVGLYIAFSIGTNNVANVVAPLVAAELIDELIGILWFAPFFGLGALIIGKHMLQTTGEDIAQLDIVSAGLVCIVTATLLVLASWLGMPLPLVQLNATAIMGVGIATYGWKGVNRRMIKKICIVWLVAPLIAFLLGLGLVAGIHFNFLSQ
jgi:sulfate permease